MKTRKRKRIKKEIDTSYSEDEDSDYEEDQDYIPEDFDTEILSLKKIDKQAHNNFIRTKDAIIKNEPTILKILKEPLLIEDRVDLLLLYEIYKTSEPSTEQWLELRIKLQKMLKNSKNNYSQYCNYTKDQHKQMSSQIKLMNKYSKENLKYKILQLNTSVENKQVIYNKYKELSQMSSNDDEKAKLTNWINWAINIPHDTIKTFPFSPDNLTKFLRNVSTTLDKELYGMKNVKEQILLFVSSKIQNPHMKKCSMGLIGSPGVGKTYISRLLAQVLDFPFEQISLGGVSNPEYLKGHQYTYIGSQPGEIVKCLKRSGCKNGILFLDEFDKISDNPDICSSLLHITDPIQNTNFKDNFLSEISIDLSYLWFIYSMNKYPKDNALRDRIHIIEVPDYNIQDQIQIVKNYLFPKALNNINTNSNAIIISDLNTKFLIESVCDKNDCGVRTLEKIVNTIVTKIDFLFKHQDKKGNLKGFDMSFDLGKIVKYPLNLSKQLIEKLL